jgi:hypothetical protein
MTMRTVPAQPGRFLFARSKPMTTLANAIHKAKKLALKTQATAYVIFDPSHLDNPPDLAYYAATEEEAETFFAGCEIVDSVEPEDIVEEP